MAAQPPECSRTAEIDLHDIIPATEAETHSASVPASSDRGEFLSAASSDDKVLHLYDALRIGWSGWANVLFAALTVLGGVLCTVRFFDTPELRRWTHVHEPEYLYQRPAKVASAQEPIGDRTGARTYSSNTAAGQRNSSFSGGPSSGSNSQGPQLPPGSPQLPNSTGSESGSRGRSSTGAESRSGNAIANRSSQSRNLRSPRIARGGMKSPNRGLHTSMHGSAKSAGRRLSTRTNVNHSTGARSSPAVRKASAATFAAARSMPNAMKSGATIFRGPSLNLAGLNREAVAREAVRRERGAVHRR